MQQPTINGSGEGDVDGDGAKGDGVMGYDDNDDGGG